MKIEIQVDVHIHLPNDEHDHQILTALQAIQGEQKHMADLLSQVIQDVSGEATIIDGLGTLVDGVAAIMTDLAHQLQGAGNNASQLQQVHDALVANATRLTAQKQELAAALLSGTPTPTATSGFPNAGVPTSGPVGTSGIVPNVPGVPASGVPTSGPLGTTGNPNISGTVPTSGPVGTSVTISGSGFGAQGAGSAVTFGGVSAQVASWSDAVIIASVPPGAISGDVVVVNASGSSASGTSFSVS